MTRRRKRDGEKEGGREKVEEGAEEANAITTTVTINLASVRAGRHQQEEQRKKKFCNGEEKKGSMEGRERESKSNLTNTGRNEKTKERSHTLMCVRACVRGDTSNEGKTDKRQSGEQAEKRGGERGEGASTSVFPFPST